MAVATGVQGVQQQSCSDCSRPRLVAHEIVSTEDTPACVALRRRVTVLEGCQVCEGSSVIL